MLQVGALHHLQIVGEAARCLSDDFRQRYPGAVWSKVTGMCRIPVHYYFQIDANQIWKVVEHDLPVLRRRIEETPGPGVRK